jgi:hypothetical protein
MTITNVRAMSNACIAYLMVRYTRVMLRIADLL